jgi:[ribosomal protein S18]-alanine N-acetyltransferase
MSAMSNITRAITVDAMTISDLRDVMAIDNESFPRPWPETSWRYEIESNRNARCLVARALAEAPKPTLVQRLLGTHPAGLVPSVVGMVCMWVVLDEAHIATIATTSPYRGMGVGKQLMQHCVDIARHEGCVTLMLEVRVSNLIAQRLYRSFGFEVTGERKKYYSDNQEDALIMTILDLQRT